MHLAKIDKINNNKYFLSFFSDCAPPPPIMQRRHSDKPVTKPPIELPVRKNYSVIETAKSRPRPKSTQQVTGGAAGSNPVASAAATNLPPPPVLQGIS